MAVSRLLSCLFLALAFVQAGYLSRAGISPNEADRKDGPEIMEEFSRTFQGLERAIEAGDSESLAVHAKALLKASHDTSKLRPQLNLDRIDEFRGHIETVRQKAGRLESLANRGRVSEAKPELEGMRKACLSCHVNFRDARQGPDAFPDRRNTITGEVTVVKADGLKTRRDRSNVVVFLEPLAPASRPVAFLGEAPVVISQKNRSFSPRVLPIPRGTTVVFPNDDTIFHNVFSLSKARPFDLGIYAKGKVKSVRFSDTGLVKVYCNIHPDMISNILVLNNPHFAKTDKKGRYLIPGVPDGSYTLRAWHEFGGEFRRRVEISGNALNRFPIRIQEERKTLGHKNKFGKPYKKKYR